PKSRAGDFPPEISTGIVQKRRRPELASRASLSYRAGPARKANLVRLRHLDDRLGLDDHLAVVEEVKALDEQLVAAALDVEHAEEPAAVGGRGDLGGHQLALGGVRHDLLAGRVVERLGELLFLRADHVLDV